MQSGKQHKKIPGKIPCPVTFERVGGYVAHFIWTRGSDDWRDDQKRLQHVTATVIHVPTIRVLAVSHTLPKEAPTMALFSSPKAVDFARRRQDLWPLVTASRVYCFGTSTAATLTKALGQRDRVVQLCAGDGREFADKVAALVKPEDQVWVIGAREPAYDTVSDFTRRGISCHGIPVYETIAAVDWDQPRIEQAQREWSGVIAFASPSAVRAMAEAFHPETTELGQNLVAVTIGETTAKEARRFFKRVEVAPQQTIEALIQMGILIGQKNKET